MKTIDELLRVALRAYTGRDLLDAEIDLMPPDTRETWTRVIVEVLRASAARDPQKAFLAQMAATIAGPLRQGSVRGEGGIARDSIALAREIIAQIDAEIP